MIHELLYISIHRIVSSEGSEGKQSKAKTSEPNIDFELDVKVHINSGKCVLHTNERGREDDIKMLVFSIDGYYSDPRGSYRNPEPTVRGCSLTFDKLLTRTCGVV